MAIILDMDMPKSCDGCRLSSYCGLWNETKKPRHPKCPIVSSIDIDSVQQYHQRIERYEKYLAKKGL